MSRCYDLVCWDCKQSLWVGQENRLYGARPEQSMDIDRFLYGHQGHHLEFGEDQVIQGKGSFTDIEPDED